MRQILSCIFFFIGYGLYAQDSIQIFKEQLSLARTDSQKMVLLQEIGYQYNLVRLDSAAKYFQQSLDLAERLGHSKEKFIALGHLSGIMNKMGNYSQSLRLSFKILEESLPLKDTALLFWTNREILWTYLNLEDYDNALIYAKVINTLAKSKSFKKGGNGNVFKGIAYRNLANVYNAMNQEDSSLFYLKLSYNVSVRTNDAQGLALDEGRFGEYYLEKNIFDSALFHYHRSNHFARLEPRPDVETSNYLSMAKVFLKMTKFDSAMANGNIAIKRYENVFDSSGIVDAAFLLSDIYQARGNTDSAYKYLRYANTIKDKLATQEKIRDARGLLFSESLNRQLNEQERKQAEQNYKSNIKIYSLLAGISLLLLVAFFLYRLSRQKHRDATKIKNAYDQLKLTQEQLIHSEKMASLGELTAGIAHEIQNPLNFVNNFSEVNSELIDEMQQELKAGNSVEAIDISNSIKENQQKINHHGKRADAIVKGMLQHSRSTSAKKESTDINALADEYLRLAYHGQRAKDKSFNATLETDFDNSIGSINIIPQDIGRVILNLITNAFYAVDEKNKWGVDNYEPTVSVSTKKKNGAVEVCVKDNGNGIPRKIIDKIFQPFFTTKPTGQGTGLGLSLSYDIVKAHGGELKVDTDEGRGSEFKIELPL